MWYIYSIIFLIIVLIFLLVKIFFAEKKLKTQKKEHDELRQKIDDFSRNMLDIDKREFEISKKENQIEKMIEESRKKIDQNIKEATIIREKEMLEEIQKKKDSIFTVFSEEIQKEKENLKLVAAKDLENYKKKIEEEMLLASLKLQNLQEKIKDYESLENAAKFARIREYEENNKDFYKINISKEDIGEIEELEKIIVKFRNPKPLKKVIYEVYYRENIKDMINRITKGQRITGIYKITFSRSGECYIGQSVDIGNRWSQYIKRALGVEELTGSKLYPAMIQHGVHNFTFEIIEEVDAAKINEREKYWADYFGSKVFGYSIRN